MDWFSWLSKTSLDPTVAYEYGLALAHNQLQQEDIPFFNHEFLQSIGVSIAKHRLEILKLAKADSRRRHIARFVSAVKKTRRYVAVFLHSWLERYKERDSSALIVLHNNKLGSSSSTSAGRRWRSALVRRSKRFVLPEPRRLAMITNGWSGYSMEILSDSGTLGSPVFDRLGSSPSTKKMEELEWASLFQDLKPT